MNTKTILIVLVLLNSISNLFGQNTFQMPTEDWQLAINLEGFKIEKEGFSPDNTMFQMAATNAKTSFNLSIFIEKTDSKGDKKTCREFYWNKAKNSPLAKENLKEYETDLLAIVEHDTKEFNGQTVNFHSINAYLVKERYWIDVHISKVGYSKNDEKLFKDLIESIAIQ